jgi:hypothetical protein
MPSALNSSRPIGSVGSCGAAEVEFHLATRHLVDDVSGVGDRSGEPVELGHHESVPGSTGGESFA